MEQGDARRAVRVVLDVRDLGRHAVLVALEVDDAVAPLVTAALVTRGDAPVVVAAAVLLERRHQRALRLAARDVLERVDRHEAAAGRGRLESLDAHYLPSKNSILSPGASCTTAFFHAEVRPLVMPRRFGFGRHVRGADADDGHVEELVDRLGDHGLVRVGVHLEGVPAVVDLRVALLADDRPDDDLLCFNHGHASFRAANAFSVRTSERARSTCSVDRAATSVASAYGEVADRLGDDRLVAA